ncbi:hypothetical protein BH24CHL5_BH24CHL5_06500 [soil metagenome]
MEIDVWQGEIAELEVDALVVAASESLFMTAGASASVRRHGGHEIELAAVEQGPISPGAAVVTGGGALAVPYVIHAVAVGHDRIADRDRLVAATLAALAFAEPLQLRRIAFALLGVEHGVFSAAAAADALVATLLSAGPTTLANVVIVTGHPTETLAVTEALARQRSGVR